MKNIEHWILTFDRPKELNRLVDHLEDQKLYRRNIFSNHPKCSLPAIINTLNCEESNSWCARSWNTMFLKAFNVPGASIPHGIVCIQDDTDIGPNYRDWLEENTPKYDFIWGPAGDQFFYISWEMFKQVGWWDERYIGCYCGDADWMKRVVFASLKNGLHHRLSIIDTHNWGFQHNDIGLQNHIITTFESKTFSGCYENQHWDFEKRAPTTVQHSQALFRKKWGVDLDINQPLVNPISAKESLIGEIDWYPWFSKKYGFSELYDRQLGT